MEMLSLDRIVPGANARTIWASAEDDEKLLRSIKEIGLVQPIMVRAKRGGLTTVPGASIPINGGSNQVFEVVIGHRRLAAALKAGLTEVPVEIVDYSDAVMAQAQAAENMVRAGMHPVDQWRAVRGLVEIHGLTVIQAAGALGLDERTGRRMERLSRLHPRLLEWCAIDMPHDGHLRAIARASLELQADAASRAEFVEDGEVVWWKIANACTERRLSRSAAIFDLDAVTIDWDEDLFAEPGSDAQFTTRDIDAYMIAQEAALKALLAVKNAGKKQARHLLGKFGGWQTEIPKGFDYLIGGNSDRLKKGETAFYSVDPRNGKISVVVAFDLRAGAAAAREADAETADDPDSETSSGADVADDPPAEKSPFTKEGQRLIAEEKTLAVKRALTETPMDPGTVLALLILAMCGSNVAVRTAGYMGDYAAKIIAPGGLMRPLSDQEISKIGRDLIADIVAFDYPNAPMGATSGDPAEWIGAAIQASEFLARFDTKSFLETASVAELKDIAAGAELKATGTAKILRERIEGNAPNYRPERAIFGAAAPRSFGR